MTDTLRALQDLLTLESRDDIQTIEGETLTAPSLLTGAGGAAGLMYAVDVKLADYELPLLAVPIASGSGDIAYADPGAAVTLARNPQAGGRFEVVGYAKRKPGTRFLVPVNVAAMTAGEAVDSSLTARQFTYGDLADPNFGLGYGLVPYGAYGILHGGQVQVIR